jgi:chromatin remodeling complex protein RSC6
VSATPVEPVAPPKRTTTSRKKKTAETLVAPTVAPVEVPVVLTESVVEENVEVVTEEVEEIIGDATEVTEVIEGTEKKRTRRVVTKDTLRTDFDNLWTEYAEELSVKKKSGKKLSLEKYLHKLQTDAYKLLKIRPLGDEKKPRAENNSGFMKPVNISPELANFIKVDSNVPITRVAITKKICEYIKEKDLQNPKDRREIVPDVSLKSIFKLTEAEKEPLTYYSMQKKIQSHIFKV